MAGPLISKAKVNLIQQAELDTLEKELPRGSKVLQQLTPEPALATGRAKQLFRLLLASAAEQAELASAFFTKLPERLSTALKGLNNGYKAFGFESWKDFAAYVKGKVLAMKVKAANEREFVSGTEGRKWWFIGKILWERYIKFGPVRTFLDETAQDARNVIKGRIINNKAYTMVDISNKPVSITKPFGKLLAGLEFSLVTAKGEKEFLDFGHVAFNEDGYLIVPTPTEIKLPWASERVAGQFSRFLPRLKAATKVVIVFEEADLGELEKQVGKGIVNLKKVEGKIHAEIDPSKLVFDPDARNQIVVTPSSEVWGVVKNPGKSPNIDIDVGATTKGGGFNFWKIQVDVSRTPFEKLFQAIFLGK